MWHEKVDFGSYEKFQNQNENAVTLISSKSPDKRKHHRHEEESRMSGDVVQSVQPTVEACFMELRSLLVGAPQGDFRNSKGSEALIGQMSVFGLHLSILLTPFSGLHITYNRY